MSIHYKNLEINSKATIDERTLYSSLNHAIQERNVGKVKNLLEQESVDITKVLAAVDDNGDTLLIDAIKKDVTIAKTIYIYVPWKKVIA